jgi:hypothetical protein
MLIPVNYFKRCRMGRKYSLRESKIIFQDSQSHFKTTKTCSLKEDNAMYVQHIAVDEFKKKLDSIYRSTESPSQFYSIHDTIKDIILKDLIREDEEQM